MTTTSPTASEEWKTYWPLVLATAFGFSFHSVATYSIGLFMEPLNQEFGWSRAQISAGLTISALLTVPLAPVVGAMIDRWGTRRLAIPGLILKAISFCVFALANGSDVQWYALWVFYSLVALGVKSTIWTAAVSGVFTAGRGMALAVTLSGTAIAQILAPPLTQFLIEGVGWRGAYIALGIGWGTPALILTWFFLYDAHDHRKKAIADGITGAAPVLQGLGIREAARSIPLIRIAVATLLIMVLTIAVIVHQVPILTETGLSREKAAYLASLAGVAGIVGKLITGYLMDRMDAGWIGGLTMIVLSLAFVLLLEPLATPSLIIVAMIIIGYSSGCKLQICAYLTSRYGGMKNFGKIFGFMSSLIALGAGIGPVLGGIHDVFGSYSPLIIAGIPGSIIGGLLIMGLGPYPRWESASAASGSGPR